MEHQHTVDIRVEIHKFGGTSVGSAERMQGVAQLIRGVTPRCRPVVVASAMAGVTNQLVAGALEARAGDRKHAIDLVDQLRTRHLHALRQLAGVSPPIEVERSINALLDELKGLLDATTLLKELTPRTYDKILPIGEKLAVLLLSVALREAGVPAEAVDADTFLETDGRFGESSPLPGVSERSIDGALRPRLLRGVVPVVTGFCGRGPDGATTILGRGGSDYSATILAGGLRADEVTIWTDVSGVFTADPRSVPEARVIEQLNYREAAEMSFYGAKVLHQRTMIPVSGLNIPVWIRNSMKPDDLGTVVNGRFTPGSHPVKAISAVQDQALLSIEGKGMAGVPGVAARVFSALAALEISATMISQSSSEASICLAVPGFQADKAESAIKKAFRDELSRGEVEEVSVRRNVSIIAAVGLGMAGAHGTAARLFTALAQRDVSVLAIAQGSSELNISAAIDAQDTHTALRAIHQAFALHRIDTGVASPRGLDVILLGCGQIGRALLRLISSRAASFARFELEPRVVAVADRGAYLLNPAGLTPDTLDRLIEAKSQRQPLASLDGAVLLNHPRDLIDAATQFRLSRPVLIDVSDAADSFDAFSAALSSGCDVITANKKPLAVPDALFDALQRSVLTHGRLLKAETTVGAGLPVVDTLEMLLATGDQLFSAEGCLSGTLGFVMSQLERGVLLSDAVIDAMQRGYTEPDPVADLSGADVARKAIILGRLSGLAPALSSLSSQSLVDPSLSGLSTDALLEHLRRDYDGPIAQQVAAAHANGDVLRYIARITPNHISVGPQAVPKDSPIGRLQGSDNMIVFTSERYHDRPLVITGPGAGVDVTAMGVLGDLLRVAAERS
jgi:bifunctional aspartokinase / homoserine dehydrogenase 1